MITEIRKRSMDEGWSLEKYDSEYYSFFLSYIDGRIQSIDFKKKNYYYPSIQYSPGEDKIYYDFNLLIDEDETEQLIINLKNIRDFIKNELRPFLNEKTGVDKLKVVNAVAAVIRSKDENGRLTVLVTQRGQGEYENAWEFPGGKIEEGETPEDALRREIKEELKADIIIDEYMTTVEYNYPDFHLSMQCFWCTLPDDIFTLTEHKAAKWVNLDDINRIGWLPADRVALVKVQTEMFAQDCSLGI